MSGIGLSQGLCQTQSHRLEQILSLPYQTSGELELFSLHRIKSRIGELNVHPEVRKKLIGELLIANEDYRTAHENKWLCVTAYGLDASVRNTIQFLEDNMNAGLNTVLDSDQRRELKQILEKNLGAQQNKIKSWFADNYDNLIYDMSGKIPFPVIRKMRANFSLWAIGQTVCFDQPIEQFLGDVAKSVGIDPDKYTNSESLWDELKEYK